MRFEHVVKLPVPAAVAWPRVVDVPEVAKCVPGVDSVTQSGPDTYRGAVRVAVGPVKLKLEGNVVVTKRDEAAGEAAMRLEAADKGIGGTVRADVRMTLTDNGAGSELRMVTEATLAGRIGDLGQPIVKRKADQVVAEFARCLERTLGEAS
ncbi:MAG: SRPBCC family protein [Chloroflexota bacterium]|nr:SRPBCC family protein [Chloroflexota bacterium]